MIRTCKILSFLSGSLGAALLVVALLAIPQNAIQADDPSDGPPGSISLCKPGDYPNCARFPDPCNVFAETCTASGTPPTAICKCK